MQTTTDSLRARALESMSVAERAAATRTAAEYATITVTLPDGSTGVARALDVAGATAPRAEDWQVAVQQGKRVDLWHVSQLA